MLGARFSLVSIIITNRQIVIYENDSAIVSKNIVISLAGTRNM
jgi:hypothetical protein